MARSLGVDVVLVEKEGIGSRVRSAPILENLLGGPSRGVDLALSWERHIVSSGVPVVHDSVVRMAPGSGDGPRWVASLAELGSIAARAVVLATGGRHLTLGEHLAENPLAQDFVDTFLTTSAYETITTSDRVVVVGSDRPLLSLVDSGALDGKELEMVVLALPDLRYVLEAEGRRLPFETVRAASVRSVQRSGTGWTVVYWHDDGTRGEVSGDVVVTNLGAVPNAEPFRDAIRLSSDGYVDPSALPDGVFVAGDVGHGGYQRVSIAIGEGARSALAYFYERQGVRRPN